MNSYLESNKEGFKTAVDHYRQDISALRTGRANAALVDTLVVEAYGSHMPLNQLASISVPEPKMILIAPWDKTVLKDIEKAIVASGSGLNPVNEGTQIRLVMPPMSEENRKELVKLLKQKTEKAKQTLRNIRETVRNTIIDAEKDKKLTQDDKFGYLKELDEHAHKIGEEVDKISQEKEKEIMTI